MTVQSRSRVGDQADVAIRPATPADLPGIQAIYTYYVLNTPVTFDFDPVTEEQRLAWFAQFSEEGPHRLLVAERQGGVVGYADTHPFRPRRAYDTTVETTIYLDPDATGCGIGTRLYAALFEAIADEDLRLAIAGVTLPNDASVALHEKFGFVSTGVMHEVGRKFEQYWDVGWFEKHLA